MQEPVEGLLVTRQIAFVVLHMVCFDIGHQGHHRLQMEEGRIALVGLYHQILTCSQAGVRSRLIQ